MENIIKSNFRFNKLDKIDKLVILAVILNLLDYISTRIGLTLGAIEINPLARLFIPYNMLWLYKLSMVIVAIYLIYRLKEKRGERRAYFYLIGANIIFTLVVLWNLGAIAFLIFSTVL